MYEWLPYPKNSLVQQIGGTSSKYFQNARSVLFHFTDNPAKDSLTKVFNQGYAGCVHFHSTKDKKCDIRVLILLFDPKQQNYIGYIPNEQIQFIDCFRKIIQQNKQQQREVVDSSSRVTTGSPQGQPQQQPQSTSGPMVGQGQVITSRGTVTMAPNAGMYRMMARKSMPAGEMQQRQVARIQRIQMQQQTPKWIPAAQDHLNSVSCVNNLRQNKWMHIFTFQKTSLFISLSFVLVDLQGQYHCPSLYNRQGPWNRPDQSGHSLALIFQIHKVEATY